MFVLSPLKLVGIGFLNDGIYGILFAALLLNSARVQKRQIHWTSEPMLCLIRPEFQGLLML
jgi:hypothetical protein